MPPNYNNPNYNPSFNNNPINPVPSPDLTTEQIEPYDLLSAPTINRYEKPVSQPIMNRQPDKVIPVRRPPAPPVRIDTCIVGDDSTCAVEKHEVCITSLGVSSCDCKPGYGRVNHRKACKSKQMY